MKTQHRHLFVGPARLLSGRYIAAVVVAGVLLAGCGTAPLPAVTPSVDRAPVTTVPVAPPEPPGQLASPEQLAPLTAAELTALLGVDADPELIDVVSGLQLLFNQEYRAVLALDAEYLEPAHTDGWQFSATNEIDFAGLKAEGATVVGHESARITGLSEIEQSASGAWQVTAVMSQLGIEIRDRAGAVLLDTRDSGPFVATYDLIRVNIDGAQ